MRELEHMKTLAKKLSDDLINLPHWLCANKLSLNVQKTEFLLLRSPQSKYNDVIKVKLDEKKVDSISHSLI